MAVDLCCAKYSKYQHMQKYLPVLNRSGILGKTGRRAKKRGDEGEKRREKIKEKLLAGNEK